MTALLSVALLQMGSPSASASGTCGVEGDVVMILLAGGSSRITSDAGTFQLNGVECGAGSSVTVIASDETDDIVVRATGVPEHDGGPVPVTVTGAEPDDGVEFAARGIAERVRICSWDTSGLAIDVRPITGGDVTFAFRIASDVSAYPVVRLGRGADISGSTSCTSGQPTMQHVVYGEGGNDRLTGTTGRQVLNGGRGADTLAGGRGSDYLTGGPGIDTVDGGPGRDTCLCMPPDVITSIEVFDTEDEDDA
jgi:Ca2+-binding RTX toxin-like protein